MVARVALANAKYHKRKNILTGIAVFLTTLLLFLVPTIGYDMIRGQFAVINEMYPNFHALFGNVTEEKVKKLSAHHYVARRGLRSDAGYMDVKDAVVSLTYLDTEGFDMYNFELAEGRLPEAENEIVVSERILAELSQSGRIGDTITVPYQVFRNGGLDLIQEKDFVICGFIADTESSIQQKRYDAFISKAFLESEIPPEQVSYLFLFRVNAEETATTDKLEAMIERLAKQFGIPERYVRINEDYLGANYLDPAYVPGIILTEGLIVAGIAIPLGLSVGTVLTRYVLLGIFELYRKENRMIEVMKEFVLDGKVRLCHPWIYLLAAGVAVATVCLSLLRPMRAAAGVSEIEAMRYRDGRSFKGKKERKGYRDITVGRLTWIYLVGNKRKSAITICSMAITGLLFMTVATVLACADPTEGADNRILSEYEISPVVRFDNKEYPELEWSEVQKNNPLTEELKERILRIDGITGVECHKATCVKAEPFGDDKVWVAGIPESGKDQLESGIVEGRVAYEELTAGDKVVMDKNLLYWYPGLKIGDILDVIVEDGGGTHRRQLEIAAIGDYPLSFTNYNFLIMAREGIETLSDNNLNFYYHIFAEEKNNAEVEAKLRAIIEESGRLEMRAWKDVYEEHRSGMAVMSGLCYTFLGILGAICIMNMINTMIHSVHIRKKEIGMLQAVGMSDAQLYGMLQLEGLFYTAGTLLVAVGGGSLAGYPVFLWARENGMFSIRSYHYPAEAAIVVILVLVIVQFVLALALGKSVKKESIIDRIRFSN